MPFVSLYRSRVLNLAKPSNTKLEAKKVPEPESPRTITKIIKCINSGRVQTLRATGDSWYLRGRIARHLHL